MPALRQHFVQDWRVQNGLEQFPFLRRIEDHLAESFTLEAALGIHYCATKVCHDLSEDLFGLCASGFGNIPPDPVGRQ